MAGKHSLITPRNSSGLLLFLLSLLPLSLHFCTISLFTSPSDSLPLRFSPNSNPGADYSFVASLEKFLAQKPRAVLDYTVASASEQDVKKLKDKILKTETERLYGDPFLPPLRVYVYEMPKKFAYDLLTLFRNTYRETSNLTSNGSPVHRLIEQHSIDYWLWMDLIAPESERLLKNVVRFHRQEEADLFYIPIFTTIIIFLMENQQCKALYREALKWVTDQPAWKRSEGRDHILPVRHAWSFKSVCRYMKNAIWLLPDMDSTGNWEEKYILNLGLSLVALRVSK